MDILEALHQAVKLAPGSATQLAHDAGIDQSLLVRVLKGQRTATPETVAKLYDALLEWRDRCEEAAQLIRNAAEKR